MALKEDVAEFVGLWLSEADRLPLLLWESVAETDPESEAK